MKPLYEVEIKSMAIIADGQRSLITYFRGGTHEEIIKNVKELYPQFMKVEDKPVVNITRITQKEYNRRKKQDMVFQKQQSFDMKSHVMRAEDYETLGN